MLAVVSTNQDQLLAKNTAVNLRKRRHRCRFAGVPASRRRPSRCVALNFGAIKWWTWRRPSEGLTLLLTSNSCARSNYKGWLWVARVVYDMVYARLHDRTLRRSVCCLRAVLGFLKIHHGPAFRDQRRGTNKGPSGKQKLRLLRGTDHPLSARPVCLRPRTRGLQ